MDSEVKLAVKPIPLQMNSRNLYLFSGVIVFAFAIVATAFLVYLHKQLNAHLEENTQRITRTLELIFNAQIDAIDVGLIATKKELERQNSPAPPNPKDLNSYLRLITNSLPNTEIIRATNERGDIIYGSDNPTGQVNVADRDYFQKLKGDPSIGLLVLNPLIGRINNTWAWSFVRRVNKPDGSFNGVVYARQDLPRIEAMFLQVKLDSSGILAIRDKDLGLIARYQFNGKNTIPTGDRKLTVNFLDALKENPIEGTYTVSHDKSIDGVSRLYSYRKSQKYGFMVSVGLDLDVALADWRKQVIATIIVVMMLAMAVAFNVRLIQKSSALEAHEAANQAKIDDQIRQIAFFDPLTHLPNRRLLNDRLSQSISTSKRTGSYGALLFLDLDNFKPLNDTHGHEAGDLLLVEAGKRISQCVREVDTVSRFGGDEFVILLNEVGSDEAGAMQAAIQVAEKIRASLSQPYSLYVEHYGKEPTIVDHNSTASIGVSVFLGEGMSPGDIIHKADAAMYKAKETGRNRICLNSNEAITQI